MIGKVTARPIMRTMKTLDARYHRPVVSILMPVFNTAKYLRAAILSILNQSFSDFELIIVDDGSTDESLEIAQVHARKDPRIRLLVCPHQGIRSVNQGLAVARGIFLARADSDDVNHPQRLEEQVTFLERHPECVAVGTWLMRTDPNLEPTEEQHPPTEHKAIEAALLRGDASAVVQGTAMFRTSALRQVGGWRDRYDWVEDLDLFLRLAEIGRLANIPRVLYWYRRHVESVCARRYEVMATYITEVVKEAWQRRGLAGEPDLRELKARLRTPWRAADYYRSWACYALQHKNRRTARHHAIAALTREPWNIESWRVLYWALAA